VISFFPKVDAAASAALYPSQGSINTEIYLQVRGIGGILYLFWDDILIDTYTENFYGDFNGFDIYFYPPNQHPYSDLGNHTVYIEIYWEYYDPGQILVEENFTLNFEIIEYFPCPEYIALNATYNELLTSYNDLLNEYQILLANYSSLLEDYNSLSINFNDLLESYNTLAENLGALNSTEIDLSSLDSLLDLKNNFDLLNSNYDNLKTDYYSLATNYNILVSELSLTKNLNYISVMTIIILLVATIWFGMRKS
jgi:hypothetical protein